MGIVTDSANVVGWLARGWNRNDDTVLAAICREIDALRAGKAAVACLRQLHKCYAERAHYCEAVRSTPHTRTAAAT